MDRTHEVVVETRKPNSTIDDLPDDVIVDILSHIVDRRDAARTSVVSRRWRCLSALCSSPGVLKLDYRDLLSYDDQQVAAEGSDWNTRWPTLREKFAGWVNRALLLHKGLNLGALIIRSTNRLSHKTDARHWIYYAMCNNVKALELDVAMCGKTSFSCCEFPISLTPSINDTFVERAEFSFGSLTSLRLVGFDIRDETVKHFLVDRFPNLQNLCISGSRDTKKLRFVDPLPSLTTLEVSNCPNLESLEILVTGLVSCTYQGKLLETCPIPKNVPDLITLGGDFARSFIYEPKRHASYSAQLVKLGLNFLNMAVHEKPLPATFANRGKVIVDPYWHIHRPELPRLRSLEHLELNVVLPIGKSIHFFLKFINAAPLLKELRIKISYMVSCPKNEEKLGFPEEAPSTTLEGRHRYKKLKLVSMSGYVGCSIDDKFILRLVNNSTLESVLIDTESEYYMGSCTTQCGRRRNTDAPPCVFCTNRDAGARTRGEAKRRAKLLKSSFPPNSTAVLVVT